VKRSLFHRTAPIRRAAQDVGLVWLQQVRATRGVPLVAPAEPALLPPIHKAAAAAADAAATDAADAEVRSVNSRAEEETARSLHRPNKRPTPLQTEPGSKWSITEIDETQPVCSPSPVRGSGSAVTVRATRGLRTVRRRVLSQRRNTDDRTDLGTSTTRR
jgi:hypothetical protein